MEVRNKIIASVIFGVAIYATLSIYADLNDLTKILINFNWVYLPIVVSLTFLNYLLRFFKWDYYLNCLKINISQKDSLKIFLSGLSMSITPAKIGETFKSYLLKETNGVEIRRTIPIVFAERITDLVGLIILALIGYSFFEHGGTVLLVTISVILIGILIIQSRGLCLKLINLKIPLLSKFTQKLLDVYESAYTLFKIKPLAIAIAISTFSWFFECLALFFVLEGFGLRMSILLPTFAFSFSTIVGAISMIPGGLGAAEGSLTGILMFNGISKPVAVASTLIIRIATLWFGVLIGMVTLSIYGFKFRELTECQK